MTISLSASAECASRQKYVIGELQALDVNIDNLHEIVSSLEKQLEKVVYYSEPPSLNQSDLKDMGVIGCDMSIELVEKNRKLVDIYSRLKKIADHLEI